MTSLFIYSGSITICHESSREPPRDPSFFAMPLPMQTRRAPTHTYTSCQSRRVKTSVNHIALAVFGCVLCCLQETRNVFCFVSGGFRRSSVSLTQIAGDAVCCRLQRRHGFVLCLVVGRCAIYFNLYENFRTSI